MDDRAIGLIGLMRRAGAIEIGEDNSGSAVSAGKAKLLLTAADASENALRHAERFTQGRRVITVPLHYTRDELGKALGIGGCSMAAVTDIGFANALNESAERAGAGYVRAGCRDDRAETGKGGAPQKGDCGPQGRQEE